jgi:DNA helicase HerA-like ATPase
MRLTIGTNGEGLKLDGPPYDTEGLTTCILGNKGAGKSNTMAVMAEEMHANRIPFVFLDPNGDALSLAELGPDVVTVGNPNHPETVRQADYPLSAVFGDPRGFIRMVLDDGFSLVLDLSTGGDGFGLEVASALLRSHYEMAIYNRQPVGVFVDEAWKFAPQGSANEWQRETRQALRRAAFDGRKRGMMLTVAAQRVTYLDKAIVFGCNVRIFGKLTYWPDARAAKRQGAPGHRQGPGRGPDPPADHHRSGRHPGIQTTPTDPAAQQGRSADTKDSAAVPASSSRKER